MGAPGYSQVVASALLRDRGFLGWPGSQHPSGFAIRLMERGLKSGTSQPCSRGAGADGAARRGTAPVPVGASRGSSRPPAPKAQVSSGWLLSAPGGAVQGEF